MIDKIWNEDCLETLRRLPDNSVDLLVTDPPYGISFMGKDWDTFNEVVNPQGAYENKKGFKKLPRQNTKSILEFFIPIWQECFRVLKDGAFAFVMSIPRADCLSRMIISLEDAGFRVGFTPIFWAYASGFPKAQNIGKAVDKRLGAKRERKGHIVYSKNPTKHESEFGNIAPTKDGKMNREWDITQPATPQAKALDGSYAGFQVKPSVEVIIVAQKPMTEKTYVGQALLWYEERQEVLRGLAAELKMCYSIGDIEWEDMPKV